MQRLNLTETRDRLRQRLEEMRSDPGLLDVGDAMEEAAAVLAELAPLSGGVDRSAARGTARRIGATSALAETSASSKSSIRRAIVRRC